MSDHGGVEEDSSVLSRAASEPDAVVAWGPEADDVADVRLGSDVLPLVVMLHGGFWRPGYDRSHVRPRTEAIAAAGWTVAAPEYRRLPGRPDATVDDVRAAVRILPVELRGRFDGRVIVMGHSAGGHLALWAASAAPAPGLIATIALAPVADLLGADREHLGDGAVAAFLGGRASARPDLDPVRTVSSAAPVLLLHGVDDETVPLSQSHAYVVAHPHASLHELRGAGHLAVIDPLSSAWLTVLSVLEAVTAFRPGW